MLIRTRHSELGFAHLGLLLLVVLVLGSVGFAGWRIYDSNKTVVEQPPAISKSFSFAAVGDFGMTDETGAVLQKIGDSGVDFTLALGDLSYSGNGTEPAWCDFVKQRVGQAHPFELLVGNHDDGTRDGNILEFRKCLPDRLGSITGDYALEYYFDYEGLARFILIAPDINNFGFGYTKGSPHYEWTASAIDDARQAGIKWVILSMHKNCITIGVKSCEIGPDIINLALEKKVDLVLQGHEHAYMRSKQLSLSADCPAIAADAFEPTCVAKPGNTLAKGAGTIIVISGTGGHELRDINLKDTEMDYFQSWNGSNTGKANGFSQFTISEDALGGEFVSTGGSFIDRFVINSAEY